MAGSEVFENGTTLLRVEGDVLLEALEAAPTLRPALDLSMSGVITRG